MSQSYTIGQLARTVGVPTSTVRYYERIGLLFPQDPSSGNYRIYQETARERQRFIRAAQATGFTLHDITTLLKLHEGNPTPCPAVQTLLEERLRETIQQIQQLHQMQQVLQALLAQCRQAKRPQRCHVIDTLRTADAVQA